MPNEEILKQPEVKEDPVDEQTTPSPISLDKEHIQALVKLRQQKLEAVKPFVSLKLYEQLAMKLKEEAQRLSEQLTKKVTEIAKQNREQSMPKAFFEQRFMKIKSIRVD